MSKSGISLIVPSHHGRKNLPHCLRAIFEQDLAPELLEIIFIINGEDDGSVDYLKHISTQVTTGYTFVIHHCQQAGVGNARNQGVALASRQYIAFLDDDDFISSNYLSSLYAFAKPTTLVLSQLQNVETIEEITSPGVGRSLLPQWLYPIIVKSRVLTMNGCKLIPRQVLVNFKFDSTLKSSEDMVLFSALLISCRIKVKIVPQQQCAIYYRVLRHDSVSWQPISYDFNVRQRLAVIRAIYRHIKPKSQLFHPRNLFFFLTRIIGEIAYSVRIIIFNLSKQRPHGK